MKGMIIISTKKIASFFLTVAVVISLFAMTISIIKNYDSKKQVSAITGTSYEYVLKDYNGHLAVFKNNESKPKFEYQIPTNSFSDYDKELLKEGIKAKNDQELQQLIEDYTG